MVIDIYSKGDYPSNVLSNFYAHPFVMDGVLYSCMEAFLQSLKFFSRRRKKKIRTLSAKEAKVRGNKQKWWKITQKVCYNRKKIKRDDSVIYNDYEDFIS